MFLSVVQSCNAKLALTNRLYNWATKAASIKEFLTSSFQTNKEEAMGTWPSELVWLVTDTSTASGPPGAVIDSDIAPVRLFLVCLFDPLQDFPRSKYNTYIYKYPRY
jgi:hypothetical protein